MATSAPTKSIKEFFGDTTPEELDELTPEELRELNKLAYDELKGYQTRP